MTCPCSIWSDLAWEALQALTSLASLTAAEQAVLASRVVQEQTALASLMDSVAWDSFQ